MSKKLILVALGIALGLVVAALLIQPSVRAQTAYSECGFLTMPNASNGAEMASRLRDLAAALRGRYPEDRALSAAARMALRFLDPA